MMSSSTLFGAGLLDDSDRETIRGMYAGLALFSRMTAYTPVDIYLGGGAECTLIE